MEYLFFDRSEQKHYRKYSWYGYTENQNIELVLVVLIVTDNNNSELDDLVTSFFQLYEQKMVKVSDIKKQYSKKEDTSLDNILKLLETQDRIYIERYPRIVDDKLRQDIDIDDIVFFGTFPSILRKTLLYKTKVEYGNYTINHILGCAHGCNYPCYAMQMSKRWGRIKNYDDWMHPRIVSNALDLIDTEIPKMNSDIQFVHLSFMSDPFMYDAVNKRNISPIQDLTMRIIRRLNQESIKVTVLTKGLLPKDLENDELNNQNEYGITLVSLNDQFYEKFEPFSAPPRERIDELEKRHDAGLSTWVSLEPYPTPNLVKQDINDILSEVSFVDKLIFGKWNYFAEVNGYSGKDAHYQQCADNVIDFCKTNKIPLHIKHGTPRSNKETEGLFEN